MKDWPNNGSDINLWYTNFGEFAKILHQAKDDTFWICDQPLKYLNIRLDTRRNQFLVLIDKRGEEERQISPVRVIKAINQYRSEFRKNKELFDEIPTT